MPLPIIPLKSLLSLSLREASRVILEWPRVRVGSLSLDDWASRPEYVNGVYLFFLEKTQTPPFYIGRVSSRSFLGRIPSHFEPREDYWMNGLSKGVLRLGLAANYAAAVQSALHCDLVLIGVEYPERNEDLLARKQRINALEVVLQKFMRPTLNSRPCQYTGNEVLSQVLPQSAA